jgi:subtilase family serine protease
VRDVTLNGEAPSVGRLPATQSMRIDVVLPMRDQAGLDSFLQELYDPPSPSYRHYLTMEQFTEKFGPSQEDYDAVIRLRKRTALRWRAARGMLWTYSSRDRSRTSRPPST